MLLTITDKQAVVMGADKATYRDLAKLIGGAKNHYDNEKVNKIAIYGENSINWVACFYSAWSKGVIPLPIDYLATTEELAYILSDSKPEIIFISKACEENARAAISTLNFDIMVHIIDDLKPEQPIASIPLPNDLNDCGTIIYTSGTTGGPKGVMLSYKNLLVNAKSISQSIKIYNPDDVVLCLLPCHHAFPLMGCIICPLMIGASVVMPMGLSAPDIFDALNKNGVTLMPAVPRFLTMLHGGIITKINASPIARSLFGLSKLIGSLRFSRLLFSSVQNKFGGKIRYVPSGGASLDSKVAGDLRALGFEILEGYGMTETGPLISFTVPGKVKIGAAGFILPDIDTKIINGEVCVRGDNVMLGYFNRPIETAEMLADGWLHTGDLGHIDEQGFLHLTGRRKEMIVLENGKNINPEDIETDLLARSPYIEDVGVFFHAGKIQAVLCPNLSKLEKDGIVHINQYIHENIIDTYNASVSNYKKLVSVTLVGEELPRTRLGKLRRFMLSSLLEPKQQHKLETSEPDLDEYKIIKDFLSENKGQSIHPGDHFEIDLGMDSLDKVNLVAFLNNSFGITMSDQDIITYSSPLSLAHHVAKIKTKATVENVNWGDILKDETNGILSKPGMLFFVIRRIVSSLLSFFFSVKWHGLNNIPEGSCIIAPNHQSYLDAGLVISPLKKTTLGDMYFGAKTKHIDKPLIRNIVKQCNVIGIDLNKDLLGSIKAMGKVLRDDKKLLLFPEGTRTRSGELGNFKPLFAIMAKELDAPIVPVVIHGAFDAFPSGARFPHFRATINIHFLPVVKTEGKSYQEICDEVKGSILSFINRQ